MKKISIVIPLFNEELLVEELVRRLHSATKNPNYSFSFILVDDGSKDRTLEKLISIAKHEPRLKILKSRSVTPWPVMMLKRSLISSPFGEKAEGIS